MNEMMASLSQQIVDLSSDIKKLREETKTHTDKIGPTYEILVRTRIEKKYGEDYARSFEFNNM